MEDDVDEAADEVSKHACCGEEHARGAWGATAAIVTFMRAARAGRRRRRHRLNALNAMPLQWKLQRSEAAFHAVLACSATFRYGRTYLHRIEDVYFRM